ncbi:MAG: hypothetical protein ABJA90_05015 [Ginsengibacter sp.]
MKETEKINHKIKLRNNCIHILEKRIGTIRNAITDAQATANGEEKSSAGDKYETSRAMSHLEKDMQAKQLSSNLKELESLLSVDCTQIYNSVQTGSLVNCDFISFFIAAGLGKLVFENKIVLLVSPAAPVSKMLSGKKAGDNIVFNNKQYLVKEVY